MYRPLILTLLTLGLGATVAACGEPRVIDPPATPAPVAGSHGSPGLRVVDLATGSEIDDAMTGLVRADGVTVAARASPGDVLDGVRKGDFVYAAAPGYDLGVCRVTDPTEQLTVTLRRAVQAATLSVPGGWPGPGSPIELLVTYVVPGRWKKGHSDMRWGGPVVLKSQDWVEELPAQIPVPAGMETKVYLASDDGIFAPLGWTATPGQMLDSTFLRLREIRVEGPGSTRVNDWLALADWSMQPPGTPDQRDAFAAAFSRPVRPRRDADGVVVIEQVPAVTVHLLGRSRNGRRWSHVLVTGDATSVRVPTHDFAEPLAIGPEVSARLADCLVLPGRLDLTTVMWVTKDSEFSRSWAVAAPAPGAAEDVVVVPSCDRYTIWHGSRGLAYATRSELESGAWDWARGAIAFEFSGGLTAASGYVALAADWERTGALMLRGEPREHRIAFSAGTRTVQTGLPDGVYRVECVPGHATRFVTIGSGARVLVTFRADGE